MNDIGVDWAVKRELSLVASGRNQTEAESSGRRAEMLERLLRVRQSCKQKIFGN